MRKGRFSFVQTGFILCVICSFFSMTVNAQQTPVSIHGHLKISGNKIVDQYNKPVVLHGMDTYNWTNNGTQYYNRTAITKIIKEWKCSAIRVVLLPGNVGSQTNLVDTVVKTCIDNGVYVIVNWHTIGASNATDCASWMAGFAKRYGNTPNILYEPWNEPTTDSWTNIKAYMETVINAIRPYDSAGIIISGNPTWDQRPDYAATDPITVTKNIAYTLHFYAATHKLDGFRSRIKTALDAGRAIFCTEYGVCEASGGGNVDTAEAKRWLKFLDSCGISSTNWSISCQNEASAAFKPGTGSTSWTDADLSLSGLFIRAYIQSQYASIMTSSTVITGFDGNPNIRIDRNYNSLECNFQTPNFFSLNGAKIRKSIRKGTAEGISLYPLLTNSNNRKVFNRR